VGPPTIKHFIMVSLFMHVTHSVMTPSFFVCGYLVCIFIFVNYILLQIPVRDEAAGLIFLLSHIYFFFQVIIGVELWELYLHIISVGWVLCYKLQSSVCHSNRCYPDYPSIKLPFVDCSQHWRFLWCCLMLFLIRLEYCRRCLFVWMHDNDCRRVL